MKSAVRPSLAPSFMCLLAAAFLASASIGKEPCQSASSVVLEESDRESPCVMVFAEVGESFDYELETAAAAADSNCAVGVNAAGQASSLPDGLRFDSAEGRLYGVPLRSGFHEFVVLRGEGDSRHEQVVLIDIQGHSFGAGAVDYAAYFAGGLR